MGWGLVDGGKYGDCNGGYHRQRTNKQEQESSRENEIRRFNWFENTLKEVGVMSQTSVLNRLYLTKI